MIQQIAVPCEGCGGQGEKNKNPCANCKGEKVIQGIGAGKGIKKRVIADEKRIDREREYKNRRRLKEEEG